MNFQEALLRKRVQFHTSTNGGLRFNCPFCQDRGKDPDTQQCLFIHPKENWGKCHRCEWKSRHAVLLVLKRLGVTEAIDNFPFYQNVILNPVQLPDDFQSLTHTYDDLDKQALNYLLKRGVTQAQIKMHNIGVSFTGRYAYRIIFPVYDKNKLVALNSRDFTGHREPKYLTSPGDKYLYHFNPKSKTVVLSEGVFKALRIARITPYNSAALLGHSLTQPQLKQIQESMCKHIIFYPDTDKVGLQGLVKMANLLTDEWHGTVSVIWPVSAPADEAPLEELKKLLEMPVLYSWSVAARISSIE